LLVTFCTLSYDVYREKLHSNSTSVLKQSNNQQLLRKQPAAMTGHVKSCVLYRWVMT